LRYPSPNRTWPPLRETWNAARDLERVAELGPHVGAEARLAQASRSVVAEQREQRIGCPDHEAGAARQNVLDRVGGNHLLPSRSLRGAVPENDG